MASPSVHRVQELTLLSSSGAEVCATIKAALSEHLRAHEFIWRPRLADLKALDAEWTWMTDFERDEVPNPLRETYALTLDNEEAPLGLMSIEFQPERVYVERLAVAPECRKRPQAPPAYKGVGTALVLHAVQRSMQTDRGGRLWLHSLEDPDTLAFYRARLGMVEGPTDIVDGQPMRQFHLSAERALTLFGGPT